MGTGWSVTVLDLDADKRSDVFLYNKQTGQWQQCITQATGGFLYHTGAWAPGWDVKLAMFNADGRDDLFLYNDRPSGTDPNSGRWFESSPRPATGSRTWQAIWSGPATGR